MLTEKSVTGRSAWERLFDEQVSAITLELDGETSTLEAGLARLHAPDRAVRQAAAEAVTAGLQPGLRTRAFVLNTLLADKSIDDRMRHFGSWIASRNLANEASDESVQALVEAVQGRYAIPQRWYTLKAQLLGIDKLADYDRMASVGGAESEVGWDEAETSCSTRTRRSPASSPTPRGSSSTTRGSTRRRVRASDRARSARTRCRRIIRTCCSTGPLAAATCSRSRTSSVTACTRISRARRACSTRGRPSRSPRPRRSSARPSRSAVSSRRSPIRPSG